MTLSRLRKGRCCSTEVRGSFLYISSAYGRSFLVLHRKVKDRRRAWIRLIRAGESRKNKALKKGAGGAGASLKGHNVQVLVSAMLASDISASPRSKDSAEALLQLCSPLLLIAHPEADLEKRSSKHVHPWFSSVKLQRPWNPLCSTGLSLPTFL